MASNIRTRSSAASNNTEGAAASAKLSSQQPLQPQPQSQQQPLTAPFEPSAPPRFSSVNASRGPLTGRSTSPKPVSKRFPTGSANGYAGAVPSSFKAQLPLIAALTLLAFAVRFYKIAQPSSVVFDEVHFGGFAAKYIHRQFFMDVHPPLAKLLIAAAAKLAGFNGNFSFKIIATEYLVGENTPVPYVAMRSLPAILGVALIPLAYLTLRALSLRGTTAGVGACLLLFDNALAAQSRLILLDSFLVFFTASTVYCWVSFCNEERKKPFGVAWWAWLASTGIFLGCVVSTKWVGLFTIATIGVSTIMQLWAHLGNVRLPLAILLKHFIARTMCLIFVPFVIYLVTFAVHLGVLNRSGEGDGFMSSAFQHTLAGHGMLDTQADVALGSTVTIRHLNTQGGLLHSHLHNYPAGSSQQQITLYPHDDENNEWYIIPAPGPDDPPTPVDENGVPLTTEGPHEIEKFRSQRIEFLEHGMEIRLVHKGTDKRLHSHEAHRGPVTESDFQNEVTGYGFPGFAGDANDNWRVEIEYGAPSDPASAERVRSLRSVFRLRHTLTGCYLFSHKVALPDWGFGQQEVTCNKQPTKPNSLWFVETSTHPRLSVHGDQSLLVDDSGEEDHHAVEPANMINYLRPTFFSKFWELQQVMWETNAGLTERHAYDSRPKTWPVMRRGINFWSKDGRQVYLMGNPFVWWASTVAVAVYLGTRAILMLREKRGAKDFLDSTIVFYDRTAGFLFLGYALHFFPFFLMSRQLFIHHYLPALYFAVLLLALLFDLLTAGLRPRFRLAAASVLVLVTVLVYAKFTPLTYASQWTQEQCERARWMKSWDFNCREFPAELSDYATLPAGVQVAAASDPNDTKHHANILAAAGLVGGSGDQGAGAASLSAEEILAAPQPGGHAFDEVPKQALPSGSGSGNFFSSDGDDGQKVKDVFQEAMDRLHAGMAAAGLAKDSESSESDSGAEEVAGGDFAKIQTMMEPGDGLVQDHVVADSQPSTAAAAARDPEALDHEDLEEILLQGTAAVAAADKVAQQQQHQQHEQQQQGENAGPSSIARMEEAVNELPPM